MTRKKPVTANMNKTAKGRLKPPKKSSSNFVHIKTAKALKDKLTAFKEGEHSNNYILACL